MNRSFVFKLILNYVQSNKCFAVSNRWNRFTCKNNKHQQTMNELHEKVLFFLLMSTTTSVQFSGNDNDHIIDACYSKNRFLGQIAMTSIARWMRKKRKASHTYVDFIYSIIQPNPFWRPSLTPGIRTYTSIDERTNKHPTLHSSPTLVAAWKTEIATKYLHVCHSSPSYAVQALVFVSWKRNK